MEADDLYDAIVEGWEKKETEGGIPYFVNHRSEDTSWDHPYLTKILEELDDYYNIRYAAYRTSMKLRHLQKRLSLHQVTLNVIRSVLDDHGYTDGCMQTVNCQELSKLLKDMFHTADHRQICPQSAEIFSDLLLNFLLNLYDVNRLGFLKLSSIKLALGVLCSARLVEKYRFFYHQLKDASTFISEINLGTFIFDLIQIPDLLKESVAFGKNVAAVVASCFEGVSSGAGISEDMFYNWLLREPQTLVWLPTLHRVAAAETVKHEAKCNICKSCPIIGFRYRCLKCFNFDICQHCFFTGQVRKSHKLKHPIQEYCLTTTGKDDTKAFVKTIRNNLSKKHRQKSKMKYLPIDTSGHPGMLEWVPRSVARTPKLSKVPNTEAENTRPKSALQSSSVPISVAERQAAAAPRPITMISRGLNTRPLSCLVGNKENHGPISDLLRKQRSEFETVILRLEAENRKLYHQLAELRQPSDTESNLSSHEAELEQENDLIHAKKEVLEDHNQRLARQLTRVQNILKKHPPGHSDDEFDLNVSPIKKNSSFFSPLLIQVDTSPQACSSRIGSKAPTPSPIGCHSEPRRRKGNVVHSPGKEWQSPILPTTPQYLGGNLGSMDDTRNFTLPSLSKSQFCQEEEEEIQELLWRIDTVIPQNMSKSACSGSKSCNSNDEMLQAANNIGVAMSGLVHATVDRYYRY